MRYRNNPFNIRSTGGKYIGEDIAVNGFATFKTLYYGIRAFIRLCQNYYDKHNIRTIAEFVHRYAPNGDGNNNESVYSNYLSSRLGIASDDIAFAKVIDINNLIDFLLFQNFQNVVSLL